LALALAAKETNTLMVIKAEEVEEDLLPLADCLVPLLPSGPLKNFNLILSRAKMVQILFDSTEAVRERIKEIKEINPRMVVAVRLSLTPQAEENVVTLVKAGVEVLHLIADEKGREFNAPNPNFIKDLIRRLHLRLVKEKCRNESTLIFGGGMALAEHVAKAIICGADAVALDLPLLIALECRLCGRCRRGLPCPVEIETINHDWGRQRIVNMIAAWHGQLLEILGAMGLRDVRRLRGEVGRAIFLEEIEKETFEPIFGAAVRKIKRPQETINVLAT